MEMEFNEMMDLLQERVTSSGNSRPNLQVADTRAAS